MTLNEYLMEFLSYTVVIPALILCYLPLKNQFRASTLKIAVASGVGYLLFTLIAPIITIKYDLGGNTVLFVAMPVLFYLYMKSTNAHVSKSLAVFTAVLALMSILANYSSCYDAARHPELGADSSTLSALVFQLVISVICTAILAYPWTKYGSKIIDQLDMPRVWFASIPVYLIILVINIVIRPEKYETYHVNNVGRAVLLLLTAMLLLWVLMLVFFNFVVSEMLEAVRNENRANLLEMQQHQYTAQVRYMEDTARARHDFRHTIVTLLNMAKSGNSDDIEAYLETYLEQLPRNEITAYCSNNAVNAVLNYYANMATDEDIKLNWHFNFCEELSVNDVDLCGIIGNILDNAILACKKIPAEERFIQFAITSRNDNYLYIIATNSFNGKTKMYKGLYKSTNYRGSGIGLASIKNTAEQGYRTKRVGP